MIKVLIVDDEKLVCQLMKSAVAWNELGMEVVAEAHNGFEALELIEKHNPKVVVTDIRMPGMDGITLLEKAREKGVDCDFVVVSGHQDFEYAKSAIQYGVENYILKPIDEDELMMTLYKIAEKIVSKRHALDRQNALENKLMENTDKLKTHFIKKLLEYGPPESLDFESIEKEFGFGFAPGMYRCVIFRIDSTFEQKPNVDAMEILINKLMSAVSKLFDRNCLAYFGYKEDESIIYVVNYSPDKDIKESIKVAFPDLRSIVTVYSHYLLTVGEGSEAKSIKDLRASYIDADKAIKYRLIDGLNKLIDSESLRFKNECAAQILSGMAKREFVALIESAHVEKVAEWIEEHFQCFSQSKNVNPLNAFGFLKDVLRLFYSTLAEMAYQKNVEQAVSAAFEDITWANTMQKMIARLKDHIIETLKVFREEKENKEKQPIIGAKEYISQNYMNNINLNHVAQAVYLNPNYFSTLFKKETGLSFIDYLTTYRINVSKELLKNKKNKIAQVAQNVGYLDPKHFSKTFKKIVGITPAEFKKLYT